MSKLTASQIALALNELPTWRCSDGKLIQDYEFADFAAAMRFVNQVAALAEAADHHPDIDIRYNRVHLSLISHDAGGITNRDIRFAAALNAQFPG